MLYTPDSGRNTPYPRLGRVLERFADLLRLKASLREDPPPGFASWKTVQRFFAGEPVSGEVLTSIVDSLLDALVPPKGLPDALAMGGASPATRVRMLIVGVILEYEMYSQDLTAGQFPLMRPELAAYPYLRLFTFDMALRYGAWAWLCAQRGEAIPDRPAWLSRQAFADALEAARAAAGLTLDDLATRCEVSTTTVKKWRSGTLPENRHIEALAKVLHGDANLAVFEFRLRLAALAQGLLRELAPEEDSWWVDDLLTGFEATVRVLREELARLVLPERDRFESLIPLTIDLGAVAPLGPQLCELVAARALASMRQEVYLDFVALPGPRTDRIGYWAKRLLPVEEVESALEATPGLPPGIKRFAAQAWIPTAVIGRFDVPLPEHQQLYRIKGPPWYARNNRLTQAEQAMSVGDLEGAIVHLRRAIELVPDDPSAHAILGGVLGQLMVRDRRRDLVDEALAELHIAVQLAPQEKMPANEIGVVLSNAGRHGDAEAAFARAATVCDRWAQHHENRGWNLLVLRRLDDAYASYKKAIELEPKRIESRVRLVAICMAMEREREAASHALCVRHLTYRDPMRSWRTWLDPRAEWASGDPRP